MDIEIEEVKVMLGDIVINVVEKSDLDDNFNRYSSTFISDMMI